MRIPRAVLGGFLALVMVAAGVYFFVLDENPADSDDQPGAASNPSSPASSASSADQKVEAAPLPVKVSKAVIGDLVMTLKCPGEAYTEKRIVMKSEVGGVVKNLHAAEGRHVREGDLLVELDDREYRLTLEKLEAQRLRCGEIAAQGAVRSAGDLVRAHVGAGHGVTIAVLRSRRPVLVVRRRVRVFPHVDHRARREKVKVSRRPVHELRIHR